MFFDIQVNGAFGVDFNDSELTLDQFQGALLRLREVGVTQFLTTIITDDMDVMCARISKIVGFRDASTQARQMVAGFTSKGRSCPRKMGFGGRILGSTSSRQMLLVCND